MKFFGLNLNAFRPLAWSVVDVGTPAGVGETVLKTYTVPANLLNANGKRLRAKFFGFFAANANAKTVRIRLGPVTLTGTIVFTTTATFNNTQWAIYVDIIRRDVDAQDVSATFLEDGAVVGNVSEISQVAAANDDAADMLLELTGQNGVASANDIVCAGHTVEFIAQP